MNWRWVGTLCSKKRFPPTDVSATLLLSAFSENFLSREFTHFALLGPANDSEVQKMFKKN
jgi:hypothetical protein